MSYKITIQSDDIKKVIDAGVAIDFNEVLELAIKAGDYNIYEYILDNYYQQIFLNQVNYHNIIKLLSQKYPNIVMFEACKHGDVIQLQTCSDINAINYGGDTPLHYGCYYGQTECVKYCLNNGSLPNTSNDYGKTPLHYACERNHEECVKLLLAHGADPNCQEFASERTPLMEVANNENIVKMLLNAGADIHIQDQSKGTALHMFAWRGYPVELLLKAGAIKSLKNRYGSTALDIARKYGHSNIVKVLEME